MRIGHEYIMTLKDTSVLINDEEPDADQNLLENVEL
jgi:hypothetical protein